MEFFPYQKEGAEFLASRKRALLADEMGLGKSAQAILACDLVQARSVIVLCPAVVRVNWAREFDRFGFYPRPVSVMLTGKDKAEPNGVTVCSYDLVVSSARVRKQLNFNHDALILDEAHFLKSRTAKRTRLVLGRTCDGTGGLAGLSRATWFLSGTPMPNYPDELWPMLRLMGAWTSGYWDFVKRFCTTMDTDWGVKVTGAKDIPSLKRLMEAHMKRRRKAQVLTDLPPIRMSDVAIEPAEVDLQLYFTQQWLTGQWSQLQADLKSQAELLKATLKGISVTEDKLKALEAIAKSTSTLRRYTGLSKVAPAVEYLSQELDENPEKKLVVFAIHRDVLMGLRDALVKRGYGPVLIFGGTDPKKREAVLDRFKNRPSCRVFIGQVQAAGTGITLTNASDVVFVEADWVPANNAQAMMRVHRIGQENKVTVRFLSVANSIDEQVQTLLRRKTKAIVELFGA